ncbi:MAG: hypothetical protein ACYTG1_06055 [Planctomycetota bacterium]|jgi:hypothetical protein
MMTTATVAVMRESGLPAAKPGNPGKLRRVGPRYPEVGPAPMKHRKRLRPLQWTTANLEKTSVGVAAGGVATMLVAGHFFGGLAEWSDALMPFLSIASLVGGLGLFVYAWRRRRRILGENDLRVCGRCLQVLRGLPDRGRCPECGDDYEIEAVRAAWMAEYPSLRLRHRLPPAPAPPATPGPGGPTAEDP